MFSENFLAPGNLSNLSFLAGAEQLICRTPPLAAFVPVQETHNTRNNTPL